MARVQSHKSSSNALLSPKCVWLTCKLVFILKWWLCVRRQLSLVNKTHRLNAKSTRTDYREVVSDNLLRVVPSRQVVLNNLLLKLLLWESRSSRQSRAVSVQAAVVVFACSQGWDPITTYPLHRCRNQVENVAILACSWSPKKNVQLCSQCSHTTLPRVLIC